MKKQILSLLFLVTATILLKAQGPYTVGEFGVAGDSLFYTSVNVDTSTLNFALAGTNVSWNFSSLAPTTQFNFDFLNPLTAGYRGAFITECTGAGGTVAHCNTEFGALTNVAFRDLQNFAIQGTTFTNVVNNDLKTTNLLEENILGVTTKISGVNIPFTCTYSRPDVLYVFPINYGNRDTSVSAYNIDLTAHGVNFIYHAHNTRINYADAYGTLVSPHATYTSTVRHRSYILHTDTLFYDNAVIPIAPTVSFEYAWFNAAYEAPVFTASGVFVGAQQRFQNVTYLDTIHCLAPRAAEHHTPAPGIINPGVGSVVVNFTNSSTNANSYQWNFDNPTSGSLNTSTATNPSHTYDSAGVYQIELIACNTACSPEKCDTGYFTVNVVDSGQTRAAFIVTPAEACIEDTVKFQNTSTNATTYQWNFGDQNTSNLKSPKHVYTLPGTYTVTLIVSNGVQTDTTTRTVTVNAPPSAQIAATGPTTFCNGDSVTLYASGGTVYHWSNGHVGPTVKVKASGTFTVTATNSCGSNASSAITVTVNTPVDTVIVAGDTAICSGDSVKLIVNTGNGATYQWKRNGQVIAGATQSIYYAKTTGNYVANVIENSCEGVSNIVHITANAAPTATISTQASTTLCSGDSLKLIATNGAGYAFQWQNNGVNIPGATAATYHAQTGGTYTDVVTRGGCSATSNSIIVTGVTTPTPVITAHGGTATCAGDSIYLTTPVVNGYTYQWLLNNAAVNGAVNPFYYASGTGSFTVKATIEGCSGTSVPTVTSVNPSPSANAGTPQSVSGCTATSITIGSNPSATAGTAPYTYSWSPSSGLNDSVIANPTVSQIGTTTNYVLKVTDSNGCTATSSVLITVTGSSLSASITISNGDTLWCAGANGSVTLTTNISGGASPFIYSWSPPTGLSSTNTAATTARPTAVGVYNYAVLVIDHNGCQASASIPVTVYAQPAATITALDTTSPCAGDTVNFVAGPGSGYSYQWLNGGNDVIGATGVDFFATSSGSYAVSVTSGICSVTSSPITVAVRPMPNAGASVHGGTAICDGNTTLITADVVNGYTYQWYQDGYGIAGATSGTYSTGDSGSYYVVETLNGCSATSNTVNLTVIPFPVDTITAQGATSFCVGDSVTLDVSTGNGYVYQWLNNGNTMQGANGPSITVSATGVYSALVTLASCSATSTGIQVSVNPYPLANLTNSNPLTFCGGDSVTLNVTDSSDYNYIWLVNVNGAVDTLPNVTPNITVGDSGQYFVIVSQNACGTVSNALYANELPLPNAAAFITTGNGYVCPGDTLVIAAGAGIGYTYQWQLDGNTISGATSNSFSTADSGVYTVLVTGGGCQAVSNYAIISYDSCLTGIPTIIEAESISLNPNPTHNTSLLTLTCTQTGRISVKLYNLLGSEVETIYNGETLAGKNFYSIPMSNLAEGMYLLRIYDGSSMVSKKIVKE